MQTQDERLLIAARIARDTKRLREDAARLGLDMLAFLLAQAEDEANEQLRALEAATHPD